MPEKFSPKKGIRVKLQVKRKKLTTYVDAASFATLKDVSERTQVPMGRLLDQALKEYMGSLGMKDNSSAISIDKDVVKARLAEDK